jgi:TolB-like protein
MNISNFIEELKRRNVFKVAAAYAIAGWLIIQIATSVFPAFEFPGWTTQFVIILVGIGFPMALIFAWAFELTPEGLKKSIEVEITESVTDRTGKKLNGLIIGVLSVALFFVLIERVFFATSGMIEDESIGISKASIAVLPFADMSPGGDQEYFSDGLSEELLNVLAKIENLKVAGRTSSFKFKGQNEDLKLIGDQLGVNHILEGSIRKSGDQIRITAQLISVKDGFHLWSETYDRTYNASNLFKIQDEISQQVLNELKVRLLNEDENLTEFESIPTHDVEAYEAFLKGNELLVNRKPEEIKDAIESYKRAVSIDASFGHAYARLSMAYNLLYAYGDIDKEDVTDLIREAADQAIFIDPSIAQAYAGLSRYYALKEDSENEIKAIEKAHELNPGDSEIINWYAVSVGIENQIKGDSLLLVAYDLDPLSPVITRNASNAYYRKRDFDKAIELLDKNIEQNPDYIPTYTRKISILQEEPLGKLDKAFIQAYQGYQKNPEDLNFIVLLRNTSFGFELDSLADFLNREIIRLFPNNPAGIDAKLRFKYEEMNALMDEGKYTEARAFAEENLSKEIEEDREGFEVFFDNVEQSTRFNDHFENYEFEEAYEIIKETYPEYLSDTLTTHPEYNMETWRIKYLFKQVGRDDLYKNLDKLDFEFGDWIEFKYDRDFTKEDPNVVYQLAMERLYNNDIERYTEILEELYFNRNYKGYAWNTYFDQPHEIELLEDKELKVLIDRIQADQDRMKNNVIQFLKDEGAWKDSWEEDN